MNVSWDQFETYQRCPQWYNWDSLPYQGYPKVDNGLKPNPFKQDPITDSQYLVRGNAIQSLVSKWAKDKLWLDPQHDILLKSYLSDNVKRSVTDNWIVDIQKNLKPGTTILEMTWEIINKMEVCFKTLRTHLRKEFKSFEGLQLLTEVPVTSIWSGNSDVTLSARLDMIAYRESDKAVIYEGKSTKKPELRKDDQVRWQTDLILETQDFEQKKISSVLNNEQFYIFYDTNQIREVETHNEGNLSDSHKSWLVEKNETLERLVSSDFKPKPHRNSCYICVHKYRCLDVYKPTKRVNKQIKNGSSNKPKRGMF